MCNIHIIICILTVILQCSKLKKIIFHCRRVLKKMRTEEFIITLTSSNDSNVYYVYNYYT